MDTTTLRARRAAAGSTLSARVLVIAPTRLGGPTAALATHPVLSTMPSASTAPDSV